LDMGSAPWRGICLLMVLGAIWGSSFAAMKIAVQTMPPMTLVAVRCIIAVIILVPIMLLRGEKLPVSGKSWQMAVALGFFGLALPFFLISWGEQRVDSSLAAILMAVMPLATMVLAHFFNKDDRLSTKKIIGVTIGFWGVVLLVGPEALRGLGGAFVFQLAIAGGALCYAMNAMLTHNLPRTDGGMIGRGVMVMIMGAGLAIPMAIIVDGSNGIIDANAEAWQAAAYLGILPTGLGTIIMFHLVESYGASYFSFVNYLNPIFGVIFGGMLLGEVITFQVLGALVLILFGVGIASRK